MIRVTRQYQFSASHRLHAPGLSDSENAELFGKCNNPYGHGHNYQIEVSARGPVDDRSGRALDPRTLDLLVQAQVLEPFDHQNLNTRAEFAELVPTTENLAAVIYHILKRQFHAAHLERVRIDETANNSFEYRG